MTETLAYIGATMLGVATLPQAIHLIRTRLVQGFGWTFSVFNFAGLALLFVRSVAIQEWSFVAINAVTTAFWGMVVVMKMWPERRDPAAPMDMRGTDGADADGQGLS